MLYIHSASHLAHVAALPCKTQIFYTALLLRNVLRNLLQNIDHVKMLYVNLCNLFYCCFFSLFCVLISAVPFIQFFLSYYDELNKDVYILNCYITLKFLICNQWRRQKFLPAGALPGHCNL